MVETAASSSHREDLEIQCSSLNRTVKELLNYSELQCLRKRRRERINESDYYLGIFVVKRAFFFIIIQFYSWNLHYIAMYEYWSDLFSIQNLFKRFGQKLRHLSNLSDGILYENTINVQRWEVSHTYWNTRFLSKLENNINFKQTELISF